MEKIIMLKDNEAKEIAVFLGMLEAEMKRYIVRGKEPKANMELLHHYHEFLWK